MNPPDDKSRIVITEDGSITCFDEETGELFHNKAGAYSEAIQNFLEPSGLIARSYEQSEIAFLDLPFGLAYNCFVFLQALLDIPSTAAVKRVQIVGVEIDADVLFILNKVLDDEKFAVLSAALPKRTEFLAKMSKFEPIEVLLKGIEVKIHCHHGDLRSVVPHLVQDGFQFDAIFHDPFSPSKMPELWTYDLFERYATLLKPDGRVLTYSSAVAIRSALRKCGLHLYRTTALGGKSGGTMGSAVRLETLPPGIFELSQTERARLDTRSGVPYVDPALSDSRSTILKRRQIDQAQYKDFGA